MNSSDETSTAGWAFCMQKAGRFRRGDRRVHPATVSPPVLALAALLLAAAPAPQVLDDFEALQGWSAHPSEGVELRISQDRGFSGKAMRLDFDFHGGAGYAIARKALPAPLKLPALYELSFRIRADAPVNDLELKLLDASGEN